MQRAIRFIGELGLRVNDLAKARDFYSNTVGLDVFEEGEGYVFFKVAEAVPGHPQLLVLFDRGVKVGAAASTLDHFAFIVERSDWEHERRRIEGLGVEVHAKVFPHFHWRSFFFADPEGNTVEFVTYDPIADQ